MLHFISITVAQYQAGNKMWPCPAIQGIVRLATGRPSLGSTQKHDM